MQKVKMWYLRQGREFLESKATKTALSLRDNSHKTTHSLDGDPIGIYPIVEKFDTLSEFMESDAPPITGADYVQHAVYEENRFWSVPKEHPIYHLDINEDGEDIWDPDHGIPIPKKHESAIVFRGIAHRLNAQDEAQKNPATDDPYRSPQNWGIAFLIGVCAITIGVLGIQLGLGGGFGS